MTMKTEIRGSKNYQKVSKNNLAPNRIECRKPERYPERNTVVVRQEIFLSAIFSLFLRKKVSTSGRPLCNKQLLFPSFPGLATATANK